MNVGWEAFQATSALARSLASGRFTVTTEVTPPVATDLGPFIARTREIQGLAAAVNVTDGAGARAHLSSLVAAHALLENGIEPVLQMVCRDRNRIALQSDLLGAMALGIKNLLVLTGDDPRVGDQPDAKGVYDLNGSAALAMFGRMRAQRTLPTGTRVEGPFDLLLGAAEVPIDPPAGWDAAGLKTKLEAGAGFVQTQFCMDIGQVRRYAARLLELGVAQRLPILIGVAPLASAQSALWMRERLFGTVIPDAIVARMEASSDQKAEGIAICIELLQQLAETPGIAGAHVMAPRNHGAIPEVIAGAGVAGKPRASMSSPLPA